MENVSKCVCPECGCDDLSVYLLADYNSTIDEFNGEGTTTWSYSDALDDLYCNECDWEGHIAKEIKYDI